MWARIPDSTEVLVIHSPPLGAGDKCLKWTRDGGLAEVGRSGCEDLLREVVKRVKPR